MFVESSSFLALRFVIKPIHHLDADQLLLPPPPLSFLFLQPDNIFNFFSQFNSTLHRDSRFLISGFEFFTLYRIVKKEKKMFYFAHLTRWLKKKKGSNAMCHANGHRAQHILLHQGGENRKKERKGKNLAYTWITIHLEEEEAAFSAVDNATYTRIYFIHSLYSGPYSILFHFVTSPILFHFGP